MISRLKMGFKRFSLKDRNMHRKISEYYLEEKKRIRGKEIEERKLFITMNLR